MTVTEIKDNNEFQNLIYDNYFSIVLLYVPSFNDSQSFDSSFHNFAESLGEVAVGKVNIRDVPDVATEYDVSHTPTFLYFTKGYKIDEYCGIDMDIIREKTKSFYYSD